MKVLKGKAVTPTYLKQFESGTSKKMGGVLEL